MKHLFDYLHELKVSVICQHTVGRYRIDLYLPDYKIAIEIDEHGHRDRDPHDERCREEFIKRELGCAFFRVNPDSPDFNIFRMCAQLTHIFMEKRPQQ